MTYRARINTIPCDVRIADDVEASVIVGTTNNYRKDISAREWGWAYRTTLEAIKHQGKKLVESVATSEKDADDKLVANVATSGENKKSSDSVADLYGVVEKIF